MSEDTCIHIHTHSRIIAKHPLTITKKSKHYAHLIEAIIAIFPYSFQTKECHPFFALRQNKTRT